MVRAMLVRIVTLGSLLALALGCGPATPASELVDTPELDVEGQTTCKVKESQTKPLIVEWPSAERVSLEARAKQGLVVVRYNGCEMQLLTRCKAPSEYDYIGVAPKKDTLRITNEDDLYANIPIGAAKLEGKLQKAGELDVAMTMVGTYQAKDALVDRAALEGLCDGATHVIAGLTVGAFEFFAGGSAEVGGGAEVLGAGAGAKSAAKRELLATDGKASACESATSTDQRPPEGCSALLRIEVVPLTGAAAADSAVAAAKTPVKSPPPPAEEPAAQKTQPKPGASVDTVVDRYVTAVNSGDLATQATLCTPQCWSAGECHGFGKEAAREFDAKKMGPPSVLGSRGTVSLSIICDNDGKPCDEVILLLERTSGGWRVADVTENTRKAGAWLQGERKQLEPEL